MGEQAQDRPYVSDEEKTKKALKLLRIFNIITALLVIGLSVFSLIMVVINAITSLRIFLIFSPAFMVAFGVCMLAAQFKVRYILKKVPFLKTALGRGLFYLYLSSVIYYYFTVLDNTFLAWASAIALFISGTIYLVVHFGCSKSLKKQDLEEEYQENYKQRLV